MGGIFGGFLSIIDSIGGGFLYILVGEAASKSGSGAKFARLLFGALIFGAFISTAIYIYSPDIAFRKPVSSNLSLTTENSIPLIFFPPLAALFSTALLELLQVALERRPEKRVTRNLRITPIEESERVEHTTKQTA